MRGNMASHHPQVFTLDARRQGRPMYPHGYPPRMEPGPVPCWTFPPAREVRRPKGAGCCSRSSLVTILVMVLALVLAALGLGAYQIQQLQRKLAELTEDASSYSSHSSLLQRQIGQPDDTESKPPERLAAHLTVNTTKVKVQPETLHWFTTYGRAFIKGVRYQDGALQVNRSGLFFIYTRVEILGNQCSQNKVFLHQVLVRRERESPLTLMEGHKEATCKASDSQRNGQVWTDNSYLGAVLELRKHDWVYVTVSQPELISIGNPNGNYFGLYEIL